MSSENPTTEVPVGLGTFTPAQCLCEPEQMAPTKGQLRHPKAPVPSSWDPQPVVIHSIPHGSHQVKAPSQSQGTLMMSPVPRCDPILAALRPGSLCHSSLSFSPCWPLSSQGSPRHTSPPIQEPGLPDLNLWVRIHSDQFSSGAVLSSHRRPSAPSKCQKQEARSQGSWDPLRLNFAVQAE